MSEIERERTIRRKLNKYIYLERTKDRFVEMTAKEWERQMENWQKAAYAYVVYATWEQKKINNSQEKMLL